MKKLLALPILACLTLLVLAGKPMQEVHPTQRSVAFAVAYSDPIPAPSWKYGWWLDDRCHVSMTGSLTVSGHVRQGFGPDNFELIPPTSLPYMAGFRTDIPGPAIALCADNPGSWALGVYDPISGEEKLRINGDGTIVVCGETLEKLIERKVKEAMASNGNEQ